MFAYASTRVKIALITFLIGSSALALAMAAADYSVTATRRGDQVAALQQQVQDLLGRIGDVEQSMTSVATQRDHLVDLSLDNLETVVTQTNIDPSQHGVIFMAMQPTAKPAALPEVAQNATVGERVQAVKVTAALLSERLSKDAVTIGKRSDIIASIPAILPAKGYISSAFGVRVSPFHGSDRMHNGIDVAADVGTVIVAPADGVVRYASTYGGYGNFVRIEHGFGIETRFAHTNEMFVKKGDRVTRGMPIATIGMSGRTTGPHLHYEVSVHGKPVDPELYMFGSSAATLAAARTPPAASLATASMGGDGEPVLFRDTAITVVSPQPESGWLAEVLPARIAFLKATDLAMTAALLLLLAVASAEMPARSAANAVQVRRQPARRSDHHGFSGGWTIWGRDEGDSDE